MKIKTSRARGSSRNGAASMPGLLLARSQHPFSNSDYLYVNLYVDTYKWQSQNNCISMFIVVAHRVSMSKYQTQDAFARSIEDKRNSSVFFLIIVFPPSHKRQICGGHLLEDDYGYSLPSHRSRTERGGSLPLRHRGSYLRAN
ncbi:unnamed protein product [Trichogramma brassicae]|uniref:Uncharacterized protein n=1 Tax=Trichogramma brassicae TaxID=86971 RepID=A0A6H5IKP5_9HYME|nr:unnamed protein product [Trichogramma brassicae]